MQSSLKRISDPQLDFDSLPPFLRVLLTTDGTVTKSLEAYFWEPVAVVTQQQGYIVPTEGDVDLKILAGDTILHRQVTLVGSDSQTVYVRADSMVRTQALPQTVREGLESEQVGIGELLLEGGLETYRKLLAIGISDGLEPSVWRSYLIIKKGEPFIKIRESFPLSVY